MLYTGHIVIGTSPMRGFLALLALTLACGSARGMDGFAPWLAEFRSEAQARGISPEVLQAALGAVQPLPEVLELDRRQPEFIQTFSAYLQRRVTPGRVAAGGLMLEQHAPLFAHVEQRYGVPRTVLAALWGMETNYGQHLGDFPVPAALATLAYDGRRSAFFRTQLLEALKIIEAGHVAADAMTGSWAGAMGHMQFIPSTFTAYAVDGDGDGGIDVWLSLADAMYSAANYLSQAGWRAGEPVAIAVRLPQEFDWQQARADARKPVAAWAALGVQRADGAPLDAAGEAAIILPQGWRGPAFMIFGNFDVLMQWNRSTSYVLAVAQLADRLSGGAPLAGLAQDAPALSREQMLALQQGLGEAGFDAGEADGIPGPRTEAAIRAYQQRHALPADGYASPELLEHLQHTRPPTSTAQRTPDL